MNAKTIKHAVTVQAVSDRDRELRASQLMTVAAEEVAWFYTSYDNAPSAGSPAPPSKGGSSRSTPPSDAPWLFARRIPLARGPAGRGAGSGFALAVNLISTAPWHPKSGPRSGLHRRAGRASRRSFERRGSG